MTVLRPYDMILRQLFRFLLGMTVHLSFSRLISFTKTSWFTDDSRNRWFSYYIHLLLL